jgi:hypothetical protein
LFQSTPF